ncbi:penicillin-binding protein 1A [Uliginosibacterium sp. H1]|uniref:penicillin-binding protein 1A n=1 Tax=Uliginosibacterium sp. H1 TaxID=3114757 RepID=UPI002E190B28|nr:penicillin-binding protein 1A [Uliginosibacterium sp. H1]
MFTRWLTISVAALVALALLGTAALGIAAAFAYPKLPTLEALTDYKPRVPLRVYTADGALIGEYGEERRTFVAYRDVPPDLVHAILAAEDDRFFEHRGVDFAGLTRATLLNLMGGGRRQGGSTITMQVARNFYLSREKTFNRKLYEILLALKIEKSLSKEQILEVYINQIYLGQRAYGFASAAQTYYGKRLKELTLAETAMLAGLPKAPSAYNPVANPERAKLRQHYVLRRMFELNQIDDRHYEQARAEPQRLVIGRSATARSTPTVHAEFVAEMARQMAVEQFKDEAYTRGIKVITTIRKVDQQAAYDALRKNALDYDRRHGYRGAEAFVDMGAVKSDQDEALEDLIDDFPDHGNMYAAIVLSSTPKALRVYLRNGKAVDITGDALKFVAAMRADNAPPNKRLRRGAVIRVAEGAKGGLIITQPPEVESAFVSMDPKTGAVRALVGGYDFNRNKFNHVTQAWRQPGSSFKPFIFSAAVEKGYTPATMMNDAPLSFSAEATGSQAWTPQNYDGKYDGPMSLRTALAKSKNVVAISLLQDIGTAYAQDYVTSRFGFDAAKNPPYLTMALGAGSVTPWQMLEAYGVFANGGYRVAPFVVSEIRDEADRVVARYTPKAAGEQAERVLDPRNVYLMDVMMKDVVRRGTAGKAMALGRGDLAGKTGTTNEYVDAWFCGYQSSVVAIAWTGFDQPKRLGSGETGGALALPVWIGYMDKVLKGVPEESMPMPSGLVPVKTGDQDDLIYEEHIPAVVEPPPAPPPPDAAAPTSNLPNPHAD